MSKGPLCLEELFVCPVVGSVIHVFSFIDYLAAAPVIDMMIPLAQQSTSVPALSSPKGCRDFSPKTRLSTREEVTLPILLSCLVLKLGINVSIHGVSHDGVEELGRSNEDL